MIDGRQAFETRAISEIDVERAKADLDGAAAVVLGSEAAVVQAELDLSYTTNHAPFAGRINRKLVERWKSGGWSGGHLADHPGGGGSHLRLRQRQ